MITQKDIDFYRSMILDNMKVAGIATKGLDFDYSKPEDVKRAVRDIGQSTRSVKLAAFKEKRAFWLGQLYLLGFMEELKNTNTAAADEK